MNCPYTTALEQLIVASPAISLVLGLVWLMRATIDHAVRRVLDYVGQVIGRLMESWEMINFTAMTPTTQRNWVRLVEAKHGRCDPPNDEQ